VETARGREQRGRRRSARQSPPGCSAGRRAAVPANGRQSLPDLKRGRMGLRDSGEVDGGGSGALARRQAGTTSRSGPGFYS
jgi:hypothetical protein